MIGGPNSNNLVGLTQLLRENGIKPLAFIRKPADTTLRGNSLLLNILLAEDEIQQVPRADWESVKKIAEDVMQRCSSNSILLQEGCFGPEALPGTLTLAESVCENEFRHGLSFERIYVDCGTGLSAIGLILGLELLQPESCNTREIVVTMIAESKETFLAKLNVMRKQLQILTDYKTENRCNIVFKRPTLSPKFGSVNASLFKQSRRVALKEGLLMDPTYSVKHYFSMIEDIEERPASTNNLFIFNGSALGLMGFQKQLAS